MHGAMNIEEWTYPQKKEVSTVTDSTLLRQHKNSHE